MPDLFTANEIARTRPPPPALDAYVVVAYYRGGWPHWRVWRELHATREAAEAFARELLPQWAERRIYHLEERGNAQT